VKVLALLASPREGGNTEILLNRVIEGITEENGVVETVNLCKLPVKPIEDCDKCDENGACTVKKPDNYENVIQKFIEADCVLFASPTYWYGVSAQMKAFIDRWSCAMKMIPGFKKKIRGKKVAVITVHGEDNPAVTKFLFNQMQQSFQYLGLDFIGKMQGKAYEKGRITENASAMKRAFELGLSIGSHKYYSQ